MGGAIMKLVRVFFCLFLLISVLSPKIYAKTNIESKSLLINPILPVNQIDKEGYFHLGVKPGDVQVVYVEVENPTNESVNVHIEPANAVTSPYGGIIYVSDNEYENHSILNKQFELSNRIEAESVVTLEPNTKKSVPITIRVPEEGFGTILGGILFRTYIDSPVQYNEKGGEKTTFSIENEFVYALAIQLELPNLNNKGTGFSIGEPFLELYPSGPQIKMEMVNNKSTILKNISGKYMVKDHLDNELFSGHIQPFMMAPMTKIDYPIFWNHHELNDGTYTILYTMTIDGNETKEEASFLVELGTVNPVLENKQRQNPLLNNTKPYLTDKGESFWLDRNNIIIIIIGLFILLLIILIKVFLNKKQKATKRSNRPYPGDMYK